MPKLSQLTFRIARLWGKPEGSVENQLIDQKIVYPDEQSLNFSSNFRGELMLIKLKEELSVIINNATIDLDFSCQLCLKKFTKTVTIPAAEREFFYKKPAVIDDPSDLFLINTKMMTVDLSEMVRQEIILHFPLIAVCSKSCKGLCMHCGKNKNKENCKCKSEKMPNTATHQPFKNLKKLLGQ